MVIYKNIRRFCRCIFVALCIAICIVSIFATELEYDGYVVKLSQPMPIMSTFGADGEAIKELEYHDSVYVVEDAAIIDELIKSGIVVFAEPNYILEPLGNLPDDTKYSEQWSLSGINYPALYNSGYDGEGAVVAVIDSGLDISHPDFYGANISSYSKNFLGDGTHTDAYYRDQLGHGTFVTSQIAAVADNAEGIVGVADGAEIMVLRCVSKSNSQKYIYDATYDSGSGSVSAVSSAIRYAVDNGADVINISLGMTSNSTLLVEAIGYANSKGVIIVAAVGNSGSTKMYYPANCENVIGVASVSRSGNYLVKSSFSQYNTSVDVTAPGGSVLGIQIYPNENGIWYANAAETYLFDSGTSYSSPIVAALAAIAKQIAPSLDSDDFLSLITVSSRDLGTSGYDTSYGYGIVDAERLLNALTKAQYGINYVLNDSEDSIAVLQGSYADSYKLNAKTELSLPIPKREGYIFVGWCFDAKCDTEGVFTLPKGTLGQVAAKTNGGEITGYEIAPVTLYAKWEIGSDVSTKYSNYDIYTDDGLTVGLIMPGNSFDGVLLDGAELSGDAFVYDDGFVEFNSQFLKNLTVGTHIFTFQFEFGDGAIFTLNVVDSAPRFDVSFYPAHGFENAHYVLSDVRVGNIIGALPDAPVFADRRFVGWYLADKTTRITKNTIVTSDMSVYAMWVYTGEGEDTGLDESVETVIDILQITEGDAFDKVESRAKGEPFAVYDISISGYASPLGTTVNIEYDGDSAYVYKIKSDSFIKIDAEVNDDTVSFKAVSGNTYVVSSDSLVFYGDANADGNLSLVDILRVLKGSVDSSVTLDFAAADIDGDLKITVLDVFIVLHILLMNNGC
ncbi:MAG: S8 family serine peptidase [Clostridia bacterium]|nr:S8 family serine peptidase [Clostridia bacterium]